MNLEFLRIVQIAIKGKPWKTASNLRWLSNSCIIGLLLVKYHYY